MPLADDQILVAGVIDTLTNFVEHPEVVAERLERVAQSIGDPRRVLAGTDCGFDTSAGRGRVSRRRGLGQAAQHGRGRAHRLRPAVPGAGLMCWICAARPWLRLHADEVPPPETDDEPELTPPTSPRPAESPPP